MFDHNSLSTDYQFGTVHPILQDTQPYVASSKTFDAFQDQFSLDFASVPIADSDTFESVDLNSFGGGFEPQWPLAEAVIPPLPSASNSDTSDAVKR